MSMFLKLKRACHQATERASKAAIAEVGVFGAQAFALMALRDGEPLVLSELATRVNAKRASTSALVDRLEDAGLVCRTAHRDDARQTEVRLTYPGRRAANQTMELIKTFDAKLLHGFSDAETAVIDRFLTQAETAIGGDDA